MKDNAFNLTDREFTQIRDLFYSSSGVLLADSKKSLVAGRLAKVLRELKMPSYQAYVDFVQSREGSSERQRMVDLLTTNETYFFREEAHFEILKNDLLPVLQKTGQPISVWCAACSTGPEAYSAAMVLAEKLGPTGWEVLGSDISDRVVQQATSGIYPLELSERIPERLRKRYCLKGVRSQSGKFIIERSIRDHCRFFRWNLMQRPVGVGPFDVIFLRNMLIYFNAEEKKTIIQNTASALKPHGYLIVGHSEALNSSQDFLVKVRPTIYQKTATAGSVKADS